MRDPHKAAVYVTLRLHTNTSQYSHWCFTVLEEKLSKWATLLYIMQLGTVHPNRGSAYYSFRRLPNLFCFLTRAIHPSFIWIYQRFTDRLYHTDPTHTHKKKNIVKGSENVHLCKAQKNYRGKRPSEPTSASAPPTRSASVRHFCGHSWILLECFEVKDTHSSFV